MSFARIYVYGEKRHTSLTDCATLTGDIAHRANMGFREIAIRIDHDIAWANQFWIGRFLIFGVIFGTRLSTNSAQSK